MNQATPVEEPITSWPWIQLREPVAVKLNTGVWAYCTESRRISKREFGLHEYRHKGMVVRWDGERREWRAHVAELVEQR